MQTISVEKRKAPEGTRAFGGGTEIPCKYSWVYIFGGLYSGGGEGLIYGSTFIFVFWWGYTRGLIFRILRYSSYLE